MRRRIAAARSRLRGQLNDAAFLAGCGLIVGAFASISLFAGLLVAGVAVVGLSVFYDRGGDQ